MIKIPCRSAICAGSVLLASACASNNLLVFTTSTKLGVDISLTEGTPTEAVFGYKRFEGALIPVDRDREVVPSVFASIDIQNAWIGGLCVRQSFATGAAAETVAAGGDEAFVKTCTATNDAPESGEGESR